MQIKLMKLLRESEIFVFMRTKILFDNRLRKCVLNEFRVEDCVSQTTSLMFREISLSILEFQLLFACLLFKDISEII